MSAVSWITYLERIVGRNHPTLADVTNRPLRDVLTRSGLDPDQDPFIGLSIGTRMLNAAAMDGATNEAKITAAYALAPSLGISIIWIPLSMIPYDPTLVTPDNAIKLVREGGNPELFDVVAYGGRQANGSIAMPLRRIVQALVAAGGGTVDIMTPYSTFVMLDSDIMTDIVGYDKTPITFLWGSFELRLKTAQIPRAHHHHFYCGTRVKMKDENGAHVAGTYGFLHSASSVGVGGPGNGITTVSGSPVVTKTSPGSVNWGALEIGSPVMVLGFVPPLATDDTTINVGGGIDAATTTITVVSTTGFPASSAQAGYLRIENEIIPYASKDATHFFGCTRGGEGTTAAAHADTTRVDRCVFQPFYVTAISGDTFTLDGNMNINATNLSVWIGVHDVTWSGIADFDGDQDPTFNDTANPQGINIIGGRKLHIDPGITFRGWPHGGWALNGCQDVVATSRGHLNGRPSLTLGSSFWVFGWSKRNTIDILEVTDSYEALSVDDRSTSPQFWDGPSEDSTFLVRVAKNIGNSIGTSICALLLDGMRNCRAEIQFCNMLAGGGACNAVNFGGAGQWVTENAAGRKPIGNVIVVGMVTGDGNQRTIGVGTAGDDDNTIILQQRAPSGTVQPNNNLYTVPIVIGLTYSASIATDAIRGESFKIVPTNGTAFTIQNPTNLTEGRIVEYYIANSSGGAMGAVTFGSKFRLAGAFTNPANGQGRKIAFRYDVGLDTLQELYRTTADQPI